MKLTKNNATMQQAQERHSHSWASDLYDVYDSYSRAKEQAYVYCRELYIKYDGEEFRILGANTMQFSVGFYGTYEGRRAFFYITKSYDRVCFVD